MPKRILDPSVAVSNPASPLSHHQQQVPQQPSPYMYNQQVTSKINISLRVSNSPYHGWSFFGSGAYQCAWNVTAGVQLWDSTAAATTTIYADPAALRVRADASGRRLLAWRASAPRQLFRCTIRQCSAGGTHGDKRGAPVWKRSRRLGQTTTRKICACFCYQVLLRRRHRLRFYQIGNALPPVYTQSEFSSVWNDFYLKICEKLEIIEGY